MANLAALVAAAALAFLAVTTAADAPSAALPPYANFTVGGAVGWVFNVTSNSSATNYTVWAAGQSFFLGDFLIFNTNSNSTVVQTLNATTYRLCDETDDDSLTTVVYRGRENADVTDVIAVPLTDVGETYFFSSTDGGVQCAQGMRFHVTVQQGRGLPPALNHPPPPPSEWVLSPPPVDSSSASEGSSQQETFYRGSAPPPLRFGGVVSWGMVGALLAGFLAIM